MDVQELAPGLWRWTAPHPEWTPADGGPDGWEREVGSVYYEAPENVVLIDPLTPPKPETERFWAALDRDVDRAGTPVAVLLTVHWHRRSIDDVLRRYREPGATLWTRNSGGILPAGVEAFAVAGNEAVFWLPEHRALVSGDAVLGAEGGGLRLCPAEWLDPPENIDRLREALRALLDLPIERVLVSHGVPVLAGGRDALARALG